MAIYTEPSAADLVDIETTFRWINNTASGGIFFPVILLVIWVIVFVGSISNGRGSARAWIYANFVSLPLAIILGLLGLLNSQYIYLLIIMLAGGIVWIQLTGSKR